MARGKKTKVTREAARSSLPAELQPNFDQLVDEVANWSLNFYGTKFVSYAILSELVRDGWKKVP